MGKKIQKICYRCIKPKEEDRLDQPFCRGCATELMREYRGRKVNINIALVEEVMKMIPKDSVQYSKLFNIVDRKKKSLNKKLKQ